MHVIEAVIQRNLDPNRQWDAENTDFEVRQGAVAQILWGPTPVHHQIRSDVARTAVWLSFSFLFYGLFPSVSFIIFVFKLDVNANRDNDYYISGKTTVLLT